MLHASTLVFDIAADEGAVGRGEEDQLDEDPHVDVLSDAGDALQETCHPASQALSGQGQPDEALRAVIAALNSKIRALQGSWSPTGATVMEADTDKFAEAVAGWVRIVKVAGPEADSELQSAFEHSYRQLTQIDPQHWLLNGPTVQTLHQSLRSPIHKPVS